MARRVAVFEKGCAVAAVVEQVQLHAVVVQSAFQSRRALAISGPNHVHNERMALPDSYVASCASSWLREPSIGFWAVCWHGAKEDERGNKRKELCPCWP